MPNIPQTNTYETLNYNQFIYGQKIPTAIETDLTVTLSPNSETIQELLYRLADQNSLNFVHTLTIQLEDGVYDEGTIYCPDFTKLGSGDDLGNILRPKIIIQGNSGDVNAVIIDGGFYSNVQTNYKISDVTLRDGAGFALMADLNAVLYMSGSINIVRTETGGFFAALRALNGGQLRRDSSNITLTVSGEIDNFIYTQHRGFVLLGGSTVDIVDSVAGRSNFLRVENHSFCDLQNTVFINPSNWNSSGFTVRAGGILRATVEHPNQLPGDVDSWGFGFSRTQSESILGSYFNGLTVKDFWSVSTLTGNFDIDTSFDKLRYWNYDFTVTAIRTVTLPVTELDVPWVFNFINNSSSSDNVLIDDGGGTILTLLPGELGTVKRQVGNLGVGLSNWLSYKQTL